jgi:hypothetical protein
MITHRARKIDRPACYHARGLNPSPNEPGSLAWPRMTAGSDRFRLRELRVSQHFSTFYGSSVQAMDAQLGARYRRWTPPIHRGRAQRIKLYRQLGGRMMGFLDVLNWRDLASVSSSSQKPLCGLDLNPVNKIFPGCIFGARWVTIKIFAEELPARDIPQFCAVLAVRCHSRFAEGSTHCEYR